MTATTMTFREAFCQQVGCRPEQYSFEVYRRCVRTKLRFFLRIAWMIEPFPVSASKQLVEKVADVSSHDELEDPIDEFHDWLEALGAKSSGFRISGKALTEVVQNTMRPPIAGVYSPDSVLQL